MYSIINEVFIYRILIGIIGFINLLLFHIKLDAIDFGMYQTMINILGLHIFFDIGLSAIILPLGLRLYSEKSLDKFYSFIKTCILMSICSSILFLLLYFIGKNILSTNNLHRYVLIDNIWLALVFIGAILIFINTLLITFEVIGEIKYVYRIRIISLFVSFIVCGICLLCGLGINSYLFYQLATLIVMIIGIYKYLNKIFKLVQIYDHIKLDEWMKKAWPLQWRGLIGLFSGYALVMVHIPIAYMNINAIVAGKLGLSIVIINTISSVSLSLVISKMPELISLNLANNTIKMNIFIESLIMYVLGNIILIILIIWYEEEASRSLLPINELIILCIAMLGYHLVTLVALFARVKSKDPISLIQLIVACISVFISYFSSIEIGSIGILLGLLILIFFIYLPLAFIELIKINKNK